MDYLTRLSIKDYPNISSEMDKFVCYSQPASDASSLEIRLTEVDDWWFIQNGNDHEMNRVL